jgi:hypothetical protein
MDALLDRSDPGNPKEARWPTFRSDQELVIVGNPPFLGDKIMRRELGDDYVDALRGIFAGRIPGQSDLCCYWFEKTRALIAEGKVARAGLLATQGIRGGANREVLKRIKESGEICFAVSDRDWILDGANVHISMVGFCSKDARQGPPVLDGKEVDEVNANLTSGSNAVNFRSQSANEGFGWIGIAQKADFDPGSVAVDWLGEPNVNGRPNSDVLRVVFNAMDITRRPASRWNIDFQTMDQPMAQLYEKPFEWVVANVAPLRSNHREAVQAKYWWRFARPCPDMRAALSSHRRFIATPRVSKHRVFAWLTPEILPDSALTVFARSDDFFFGVLHSRIHEVWSLAQGTQLEDRPRYTPTTCFETFPFPWDHRLLVEELSPAQRAHHAAISAAAKNLDELRSRWLNPPEWTHEEILEFPATPGGPWDRFITSGTNTARYPRLVPRDATCAKQLAQRTLTKLYNERPAWLATAHTQLDSAVSAAYGFPADLKDEQIIGQLLTR